MKKVLFLFIMALIPAAVFPKVPELKNPVIKEIRFEGTIVTISSNQVLQYLPFKVGDVFKEKLFNDAIKTLGNPATSPFNGDVKGYLKESPEGVILTFVMYENPLLNKIVFEGNPSIHKGDLLDIIPLMEGMHYNTDDKIKSIERIKDKYLNEGFIEASVSASLVPVDIKQNKYDLVFNITEGKKIVVEKIDVQGAVDVNSGEVKGIMKTKEQVFILQSGILNMEDFYGDKERITMLYQQKGFLDIKVLRLEWKIEELGDDKHKAIVVYVAVSEGPKYYVGNLSITNNVLFSSDDLEKYIELKPNDVYDKLKMDFGRYQIYNKYSDNGYLYANVSYQMVKNPSNFMVDTVFYIHEGERAHIESVTLSGNTKTKDNVLLRELIFTEGELWVQTKVRLSYEKLVQLQYFGNVNFVPQPGSAEGLVNIDIQVEEQRTGLITFGIGYGTASGFNGTAQITEKNFLGTGRVIGFKGEYGQKRQLLEVSFTEPWLFETPTYFSVSFSFARYLYDNIPCDENFDGVIDGTNINYISNNTASLPSYTSTNSYYKQSFSFGLEIKKRLGIFWDGFISFGMTWYRDMDANFKNPLILSSTWQNNSSLSNSITQGYTTKNTLGLGFNWNSTDHPLNPLRGILGYLYMYNNGGLIGGNINYIRIKYGTSFYWNPFWKFVFALHGSGEFIMPQFYQAEGGNKFVYDTADMLYFDGVYELRGWMNYPYRGESKAFYSTELRFEIYGQELWGAFFFDIGSLWAGYKDFTFQPYNYMFSFGFGVKLNIPGLPIRLYLARKGYFDDELNQWILEKDQYFLNNWQVVFSIQGLF
ncbi:MAG: outer membrane protein assembly factor BamA [Spirochaetes bacterium GWF1_51_8]|nr:MAG: outer membrane protein assembly factor BamA [Spirochaetes bacterium GWF1_51_8]